MLDVFTRMVVHASQVSLNCQKKTTRANLSILPKLIQNHDQCWIPEIFRFSKGDAFAVICIVLVI